MQFEETQSLNPFYTVIVLLIIAGLTRWIWNFLRSVISQRGMFISVFIAFLVFAIVGASFALERLTTRIDESGIHYCYFAGIIEKRDIPWNAVYYTELTRFRPWFTYGSRGGMTNKRHENEYVISGRLGLRIVLKNGTVITLGTHKPDELSQTIQGLKTQGIITFKVD